MNGTTKVPLGEKAGEKHQYLHTPSIWGKKFSPQQITYLRTENQKWQPNMSGLRWTSNKSYCYI